MPLPTDDRYLTCGDIEMRLINSIVNYKGVYYWCQLGDPDEHHSKKVRLFPLNDSRLRNSTLVSANDPDLDPTSPELGWLFDLDLSRSALYMTRAPYRKQKQGLGPDNLVYYSAAEEYNRPSGNKTDSSFCVCEGMHELLHRKRIPFDVALARAKDRNLVNNGAPVSKHIAVILEEDGTYVLYRHLTKLGVASERGVKLFDDYIDSLTTMSLINNGIPIDS